MKKTPNGIALVISLLALTACGRSTEITPAAPNEAPDPTGGLAPPLLAPGENTAPSGPPSYEVSIATAAADHNQALERCKTQPEAVRTQCEQEANAAFAELEKSFEPLRGNQQ